MVGNRTSLPADSSKHSASALEIGVMVLQSSSTPPPSCYEFQHRSSSLDNGVMVLQSSNTPPPCCYEFRRSLVVRLLHQAGRPALPNSIITVCRSTTVFDNLSSPPPEQQVPRSSPSSLLRSDPVFATRVVRSALPPARASGSTSPPFVTSASNPAASQQTDQPPSGPHLAYARWDMPESRYPASHRFGNTTVAYYHELPEPRSPESLATTHPQLTTEGLPPGWFPQTVG